MMKSKLFDQIAKAEQDNGKPAWQQLLEAIYLRFRKSSIGISEYFEYGIYRREVSLQKTKEFIGWKESLELDKLLNNDYSRVLANDKLLNYLILHAAGYPIPEPIASYSSSGRRICNESVLQTIQDVRDFLDRNTYPFYVKPISAGYGKGVLGVHSKEGNSLRLLDKNWISIDDFLKPFSFLPFGGMLFQKPLKAHPSISELTGSSAVCCVRFICFVTPSGPTVHTAFWKITAGNNMLDNFTHGKFGNCLASIDINEGRIVRTIARLGPSGEINSHPTTGRPLTGFRLPDWDKAMELVCSATKLFPGLQLQNWDVALCPQGPVLLELNTESELAVPQAISGHGFKDDKLRAILDEIEHKERIFRQQLAAGPKIALAQSSSAQQGRTSG